MTGQSKSNNNKKRTTRKYKPAISQWRLDFVRLTVLLTAFALIVYDAYVSYQGFHRLDVGRHAPIVFCVLIFSTQLAVGVLHALGDDFGDVMVDSGHDWGNTVWKTVLKILYAIDIMSNAVEFGLFDRWSSPLATPVETFGGAVLIIGMAVGLTFADECLLRLYDRVQLAASKNWVYTRRYRHTLSQHHKYLSVVNQLSGEKAENQAQYEADQWKFGDNL